MVLGASGSGLFEGNFAQMRASVAGVSLGAGSDTVRRRSDRASIGHAVEDTAEPPDRVRRGMDAGHVRLLAMFIGAFCGERNVGSASDSASMP